MQLREWRAWLTSVAARDRLAALYGPARIEAQQRRYQELLARHRADFGERGPVYLVSAPGRTEIVGNHTDHNRGKVLAAAISLDTLAAVSPRTDMRARVHSQGYPDVDIDLNELAPLEKERGTSAAIVRGVAARMAALGCRTGGFDAAVTSQVLGGSGLSSSAAYEVLICAVLDHLYNGFALSPVMRAQIAQHAENAYFGKPCGLMDQMASSVGGLVHIDFGGQAPAITPLHYSFAGRGHRLVMVNTGGSHDDLVQEYAAIRAEMLEVASLLGHPTLRDAPRDAFEAELPRLRDRAGDRALLRAMHFYEENDRVDAAADALRNDDLTAFLWQVNASGRSSWEWLQNIASAASSARHQPMALALALAEKQLSGQGARRVHGGGFAGTTLNFVPDGLLDAFVARMDAVFGRGACQVLDVRSEGAVVLAGRD